MRNLLDLRVRTLHRLDRLQFKPGIARIGEQGWRSGESARLPPLLREVFLRVLRFPLSSKTNISKFQFDLDVRHFGHEPLARVIAQALPVLDVKFHLHFIYILFI